MNQRFFRMHVSRPTSLICVVPMLLVGSVGAANSLDIAAEQAAHQDSLPAGLSPCAEPLTVATALPHDAGEILRYSIQLLRLKVGEIHFEIARRGLFNDTSVTEYRGQFRLKSMLSAFLGMEGRAAALVPDGAGSPIHAKQSIKNGKAIVHETQSYSKNGQTVHSVKNDNGIPESETQIFATPMHDFLSAFYFLRALPADAEGCAVLYANQKAHTVWIAPGQQQILDTAVGKRASQSYSVRYAAIGDKDVKQAQIWLGTDEKRLPYRAEGINNTVLQLQAYHGGS